MIELHLHLDGSLESDEIVELAKMSDTKLPTYDIDELRKLLTVDADCRDLKTYLEKFDLPLCVLQTEDCITRSVEYLCKRLAKDGIIYAEIRFAPQLHLQRGLCQEKVVAAAVKGIKNSKTDGFFAKLILCCMRGADSETNMQTVDVAKKYLGRGVACVDLAGNEFAYPNEMYADVFKKAKNEGVPFVIHAGEAREAESVISALKMGALRIGHGVRAAKSTEAMELLRDTGAVVEKCYTSNLQTCAVTDPADDHLPKLIANGVKVTLSTDNSTVSGTNLKAEYALVKKAYGFSDLTMADFAMNAASGAFLTDEEKIKLKNRIREGFSSWIGNTK